MANVRFSMILNKYTFNFAFETPPGVNSADLLSFSLRIVCLIIFCDYWCNLRKNYFAHVTVDFGCGFAALEIYQRLFQVAQKKRF
ncbi:hypothetical protein Calab_2762 [Caldithrix abyssi DSM 13497]|uniref:Uncharacterized protein n=1 Tax=Caldithrix abyssi DSM 13497 TaxID=880073 RepID=H1XQU7_CALAY|nr:hypothetical protein Calab_2762 [Caldithrix abyssi DSM 13497]